MFLAHVEAHFESSHRNGPAGHKCAGTFVDAPKDVRDALYANPALMSDGDVLYDEIISTLRGRFDFHGHSWLGIIEWSYDEHRLDENGWGPDFGRAKQIIRQYDHHNLNLMMALPSAENLAKAIYDEFTETFGFTPDFVKLHEGAGNTLVYSRQT